MLFEEFSTQNFPHLLKEARAALQSELDERRRQHPPDRYQAEARPFLSRERLKLHRMRNILHSVLLLVGLMAITAIAASLLWGWMGLLVATFSVLAVFLFAPRMPPEMLMRIYKAQQVDPNHGRQLMRIMEILSDRAELSTIPRLYTIPSATLNAFATGRENQAVIGMTEGMLRKLNLREIAAVLAHEISHIRNNDLWIMGLADTMSRVTQIFSFIGIGLVILNLPLALFGQPTFSWSAALLLYFTPTISSLLQLALSRAREFDADLEAAQLTGDPAALASALSKLDRDNGHFWEDMLAPGRRIPQPSLLRSHPPTKDRIARLADLRAKLPPIVIQDTPMISMIGYGPASLHPRYHWPWPGIWY